MSAAKSFMDNSEYYTDSDSEAYSASDDDDNGFGPPTDSDSLTLGEELSSKADRHDVPGGQADELAAAGTTEAAQPTPGKTEDEEESQYDSESSESDESSEEDQIDMSASNLPVKASESSYKQELDAYMQVSGGPMHRSVGRINVVRWPRRSTSARL